MSAVYLEVTHSLDTHSCIIALHRFRACRGNPALVLSDNCTNFVGAEREAMTELDQERVSNELSTRGVQWRFNPPAAP